MITSKNGKTKKASATWNSLADRSAFTIIELLVVIAIMSLMASLLTASISSLRMKGRDAKRIADMQQIVKALQLYAQDHGGAFPKCAAPGYPGGCDLSNFNGTNMLLDSSLDGVFLKVLEPYMGKVPVDPKNDGASGLFYAYGNGRIPTSTSPYYLWSVAVHLEDSDHEILKTSNSAGAAYVGWYILNEIDPQAP